MIPLAHTDRDGVSAGAASRFLLLCLMALLANCSKEPVVTVRILGLSDASRVNDFNEVIKKLPSLKIVSFDSDHATALVRYEPTIMDQRLGLRSASSTPSTVIPLIDGLISAASGHTFTVTAPTEIADKNLKKLTFKVNLNDCKGCRYAAYIAVAKLEGLDRATVDSANHSLVAWIDPTKTSKKTVGDALTEARIKWRDK